jgi:hypothetical protein
LSRPALISRAAPISNTQVFAVNTEPFTGPFTPRRSPLSRDPHQISKGCSGLPEVSDSCAPQAFGVRRHAKSTKVILSRRRKERTERDNNPTFRNRPRIWSVRS